MDLIKSFINKTILIVGDVSSFGLPLARFMLDNNCRVLFADLPEQISKLCDNEKLKRAHYYPLNIYDQVDIQNTFKLFSDNFGSLNYVVNCSALNIPYDTSDNCLQFPNHFRDHYLKTVTSAYSIASHSAQLIVKGTPDNDGERGVIINAVTNFSRGPNNLAQYCASRAIQGMTLTLARELAPSSIRVVGIIMGKIDNSPLRDKFFDVVYSKKTPLKSLEYSDFYGCVNAVLSNPMINGTDLTIDLS